MGDSFVVRALNVDCTSSVTQRLRSEFIEREILRRKWDVTALSSNDNCRVWTLEQPCTMSIRILDIFPEISTSLSELPFPTRL